MDLPSHMERPPPWDGQAEQALLCSLLIAPELIEEVVSCVRPEDFFWEGHRIIFEAICELARCANPVEIISVREELEHCEQLERIGGEAYLRALFDCQPTAAHWEYYAKIVADRSLRRRLIRAVAEITRWTYDTEEAARDIVQRAEASLFALSDERERGRLTTLRDLLGEAVQRIEAAEASAGVLQGITSGIQMLDNWTNGWQASDLIILAGRPATGKTAAALQFAGAAGAAKRGSVVIFSMEMSNAQIANRFLAAEARVDSVRLRTGFLSENGFGGASDWTNLTRAMGSLGDRPILVDDSSVLTPMEVRATCRRVARSDKGLGLILLDYLQLMSADRRTENRNQEVGLISRDLKRIAKEFQVPVICLSQLNRGVETRSNKRPLLSDLRESGDIEAAADLVMMLYRPNYYAQDGEDAPRDHVFPDLESEKAEIIVAKHRNGPVGVVPVMFQKRFVRYDNLDMHTF